MARIFGPFAGLVMAFTWLACEAPPPALTSDAAVAAPDADAVVSDAAMPPDDGEAADAPVVSPPQVIDGLLPERSACESDHRPVVMVHGMLASGDTWARHTMRFEANGSCPGHVVALDWNTLGGVEATEGLAALVDTLLEATGAAQVDLVGHSAGTGVSIAYLSQPERAAKVAHYAHVGAGLPDAVPGPNAAFPTLNLWSAGDMVASGADGAGLTNVMLETEDHYQVATSEASFEAIYTFFNDGEAPDSAVITPAVSAFDVWGKGLTLGENTPVVGGSVNVWEVDEQTGVRLTEAPVISFTVGQYGWWGPLSVSPGAYYELVLLPAEAAALPVRHYFMPFAQPHDKVVLRALPGPGSMVALLLGAIPFDDTSTVQLVAYSAHQAVVSGRDTLTVGDVDLAMLDIASAENTTIAVFCYDADGDGATGGTPIGLFYSLPFLKGVDIWIPADPAGSTAVTFNGRTLNVAQNGEGAVIATLE